MLSSRIRRFAGLMVALLLFLGLIYGAGRMLFPLQMAEWASQLELRRNQIHEVRLGQLQAYTRDHCAAGDTAAGHGPEACHCVALIHGLGDQALTWKRLLLEARGSWLVPTRLYAINLPGTGDSRPPQTPEGYRVREMAGVVADALAAVPACSQWMVVGNSLGGWVAAWMALDQKAKVNRLLLADSAGLKAGPELDTRSLLGAPTVESLKEFQRRAYYKPREIPEKVWKQIAERARQGSNSGDVMKAQTDSDYLDHAAEKINVPTIVLFGEADRIISSEKGRRIARLIPGAIYREEPRCGHLPQKECPAAVIQAMNELARLGVTRLQGH